MIDHVTDLLKHDKEVEAAKEIAIRREGMMDLDELETVACGCGDYRILVSETGPIYDFGAICLECGNHFGWSDPPEGQ